MHSTPSAKYSPLQPVFLPDRKWPDRVIERAPIWLHLPGGIRVCVLTARFVSRLLGVVSARKEKRLEAAQAIAERSEPQNFVTAARAKKC